MNIIFNIDYSTRFGEELILNLVVDRAKGGPAVERLRMMTGDGKRWTCSLRRDFKSGDILEYYYSLVCNDSDMRSEWQVSPHRLSLGYSGVRSYVVYDRWTDTPSDAYAYSSAFTTCINGRRRPALRPTSCSRMMCIKVRAPQLRSGQKIEIVGNDPVIGAWNIANSKPLQEYSDNEWTYELDPSQLLCSTLEFKFIVRHADSTVDSLWEEGHNRMLTPLALNVGEAVVYELEPAAFRIAPPRCAGTLVPVFSLRSATSFGLGDFGDLRKMVDWVALTGQKVLQVLPINDTTTTHTWTDSYPYSCISIFALHPQYADFTALPAIKDAAKRDAFEKERVRLNALKEIDYEGANNAKTAYLRQLYAENGSEVLASAAFKDFFAETSQWLAPYAQYCHLRETYGTACFDRWPDHRTFDESDRKALTSPRTKAFADVAFYYYVQFVLHTQMSAVHDYARSKGVILKGDIPIGVSRYGCDVWMEPRYFNLNGQAGAPPDAFSVNGQNWGFPTYNWDEMLRDGCLWWVRRFRNMSHFFDAYRIDHVLGFFRIWEIPIDAVHGLLGHFSPSLGMTRGDIEAYGLRFQEDFFTRPFIADWIVDRVFGANAGYVRDTFLIHEHDDIYRLKPDYDTERKIEAAFAGKTDVRDEWIRDGLYALASNVLFVRDHKDASKFHPRISAQFSFIYEALYDSDKQHFNRLYNDYFYHLNNQFWYREAMKKLPLLVGATRMLVCAEDLGMVPDCVPWVMDELKILSLELQSMPKDPAVEFGVLSANPVNSVCTISSHDMPTLRQWWDEDEQRTQKFYGGVLHRDGPAPHPLPGWLARDILLQNLMSPSMLCILSIQDWLAIDERLRLPDANAERINIPANPKHYWRYRMHIPIEQLMAESGFDGEIRELVRQSGRQ